MLDVSQLGCIDEIWHNSIDLKSTAYYFLIDFSSILRRIIEWNAFKVLYESLFGLGIIRTAFVIIYYFFKISL